MFTPGIGGIGSIENKAIQILIIINLSTKIVFGRKIKVLNIMASKILVNGPKNDIIAKSSYLVPPLNKPIPFPLIWCITIPPIARNVTNPLDKNANINPIISPTFQCL